MRLTMAGPKTSVSQTAPRFPWRLLAWALAAGLLGSAASASHAFGQTDSYEPLPTLAASDFLDADVLKGDHYAVENQVSTDGLFNTYTIQSEYGTFQPQGTSLARIRIHEIGAIAELKEVDKVAVAAGAAVDSAVNIGKGTFHLVTNPVETVQGIGSAAGRLFTRIGRGAKRAREKYEGGAGAGQEDRSTGSKIAGTTQGVAKDLLGVNRAMRFWAQKLYVDPYTHNPVLRDELQEVADYDAGGRFSIKLMPFGVVGTVLGSAATVNNLVWTKEPDELLTLNENRLKSMEVSPEDSRALRLNPHYTLTVQTRLVASLDALPGVTGRPEYVARAAGAEAEVDARFFQESAYMAEMFHQAESPLIGIAPDMPGACAIAKGDRFVCLYSLDYIVWTEGVARNAARVTQYAEAKFPDATRELWLTGRVSPRTARELTARGWMVREKAMNVLPAAPVRPEATPIPSQP